MAMESDTLEVKGLDQILKALKAKPPVARIGILGSSGRANGKATNAEVGAAHEYGTTKMPQRSFLRVPLIDRLDKNLSNSKAFDPDVLNDVIKKGSVFPWLNKVANEALVIVLGAFSSNGYGKWAAWKGTYTSRTGQILVDTNQLRESITVEVKA